MDYKRHVIIEKEVAMKNRYRKLYFEEYAAQTLKLYLMENTIVHRDCPDLEISALQMGVEVTQAIKEDIIYELRKETIYASYALNPFDLSALLTKEDVDGYFGKIKQALLRKIQKSSHYTRYQHNGLYIFTHCFLLTNENVQAFFTSLDFPIVFYDAIYLNGVDCLYCYHVKDKSITTFHFESKDLVLINQLSLRYEERKEKEKEDAKAKR